MSTLLLKRPPATPAIRTGRNLAPVIFLGALAAVIGAAVAFGPLAAVAVVGLGVLVIAIHSTEVVLHLLVASVFVESVTIWNVRVGRLAALGALVVVVARFLIVERSRVKLPTWALIPIGSYVAWAIASFYWSRDTGAWSEAMGQIGLAVCVFLAFAFLVGASTETVRRLLQTLVVGAVGAAFLGFTQIATIGRIEGLQGDANLYALYQAMAIPAALVLGRRSRGWRRTLWYLAPIPLVASIFASQSRGGLITLAIVTVWSFVRGDTFVPRSWRAPALVVGAVMIAVLVTVAGGSLMHRLSPETIVQDRASARLDIWHVAWGAFTRQPVLGLGSGNFKTHSVELLQREPGVQLDPQHKLLRSEDGIEVHNVYLESLTELGVPGFVFYASLLLCAAFALRRIARRYPETSVPALPVMLGAFMTATLFLSTGNNKLLWMLIGTAAAFDATRTTRTTAARR